MLSSALRVCPLVVLVLSTSVYSADLVPHGSGWLYLNPQVMADNPGSKDANFNANWFKSTFNVNGANKFQGPAPEPFARTDVAGGSTASNITAFTEGSTTFVRKAATLIQLPVVNERLTSYFRHSFTTTAATKDLGLSILADDGARIYLDGEEVGNFNCCLEEFGGSTVPTGTPTAYTNVARAIGVERYTTLPLLSGKTLNAGNHILAVALHQQAIASGARSDDAGFSARLVSDYVYRPFVDVGSEWKFRLGDEEPSGGTLDWTTFAFNDGTWGTGKDGFGYETGTDPALTLFDIIQTDVIEMANNYSSLFLRKKFTVANPAEVSDLSVQVDYDDGFVMYVNGGEIRRTAFLAGTPAIPVGDSVPFDTFSADHESTNNNATPAQLTGGTFSVKLADFPGLLKAGDNIVAIHGLNTALTSSDFFIGQIRLAGVGPFPTSGTPGDFDSNGALDVKDIDALSAAVRAGNNPAQFDVTSDGKVDQADRAKWISELKKTWVGDSNLNGEFGSADFVAVFTVGEYEDATSGNSGWADGDWSGDGDFTSADFVAAFTEGGYEKGPRPATAAVPEPSAIVLLLIGAACLVRRGLC